jgi:hypothetical protein
MASHNRVVIETGSKKVFASAIDWPGWSRSGRTEDEALATLATYTARYRAVAERAAVPGVTAAATGFDVMDRVDGGGATDFGVPGHPSAHEDEPMTEAECARQVRLLQACWATFDDVASTVSAELRKGPRGGGRDRDEIVLHVFESERNHVRKLGLRTPASAMMSRAGLLEQRDVVCQAIERINTFGETPGTWPLRYALRRIGWHVLDHAWEMEDKDRGHGDDR